MAQESFDSLTPGSGRQLAQDEADTKQIKGEIEKTRIEMRETIDEIQDRLRPDHLLEEARARVTGAAAGKVRNIMSSASEKASTVATRARGAGNYVSNYATDHPIRVAVTIGALAWWMLRGRSRSYEWDGVADTEWDDSEAMAMQPGDSRSLRNRVGEYASSARDTVGEYASSVGEYASSAKQAVGEYASSARDTVGEYASSARETVGEYAGSARESARMAAMRARSAAGSAASTVDDFVTENPMAAGAIALVVGAVIGLSVPRSEYEDRAMGETRDRAWQQAKGMAQNLKANVSEKMANAAENLVGDSIKNAATTPPAEPMGRA